MQENLRRKSGRMRLSMVRRRSSIGRLHVVQRDQVGAPLGELIMFSMVGKRKYTSGHSHDSIRFLNKRIVTQFLSLTILLSKLCVVFLETMSISILHPMEWAMRVILVKTSYSVKHDAPLGLQIIKKVHSHGTEKLQKLCRQINSQN